MIEMLPLVLFPRKSTHRGHDNMDIGHYLHNSIGRSVFTVVSLQIRKYHDEINLGIPQPGKDVGLTPIWCHIFRAELSDVASPVFLKFNLVFVA